MGAGSSRADAPPRRRARLGLAGCFCGGSSAATGDGGGGLVAAAASSRAPHEVESRHAERAVAGLDFRASMAAKDLHISIKPDPRVHPSSSTVSHHLRFNHLNCHENKEDGLGTENAGTSGLESSPRKDCVIRGNFNYEVGDAERTSRGGIDPTGQDAVEPAPDNVDTDTGCITEVGGSISESNLHSSLMTSQRTMPYLEDGEIALHKTSSAAVLSSERSDISQSSLTPVLPATSTASPIIGESIPDAIPTRADVPIFSGPQGQIGGSTLHDDMMSIFSNDGPGRSRDSSNNETRRNHRRVLWDAFSRRGSRGYLDSDTDDLGFYSRWLDIGDDLFGDEVEEARYFHRRRHGSIRVSQYSRSRIREHRRAVFDSGNEQSTAACPLGIHQIGRCTCDSFLIAEESSAQAGISRIVMLTEALFEVLDEIHRQPASLSLPMVSVQAPESLVNSLPCKSYKKLETAQCSDDMEQCHICLTEYEDGDQIRSLPCKHEFHLRCVDKWLKEGVPAVPWGRLRRCVLKTLGPPYLQQRRRSFTEKAGQPSIADPFHQRAPIIAEEKSTKILRFHASIPV